ncbi:MAG TPA: hypothetical protein VGB23_07370 [Nitrospirota bacterium]|jgi:hypothetical protein
MDPVYLVLSGCAFIVMLYALYRIIDLRKRIPGGVARNTVTLLAELVGVFTLGYLVTPFYSMLPQTSSNTVLGILFFAVAIFVVIVVDLFHMVVSEMGL